MKIVSKPILAITSALLSGLAVFAALQGKSSEREKAPMPKLNVQTTSVNREARGVTSYAPVIKRVAPSVVNIYSTRTVQMRRMPMPFFDDPMFRQFMPGDPNEPQRQYRGGGNRRNDNTVTRTERSLGSGVIVSPDGYILTANHVVEGADPDGVKVALVAGNKEFTAKI